MNNKTLRGPIASILQILFAIFLISATETSAQNLDASLDTEEARAAVAATLPPTDGIYEKVSHHLVSLQTNYLSVLPGKPAKMLDPTIPISEMITISNGYVVVDAVAASDAAALHSDLLAFGALNVTTYEGIVSARFPIEMIDQLGSVDSLRFVRPSYMFTDVGSVDSQGDAAQLTDDARTAEGIDGTGIIVGVMSDSYDCLGGEAADIASGDLPNDVINLDDSACPGGSDEGRAMAQIIYDVAPNSDLIFHTAVGGFAVWATGIGDLVTAGADVIVDDITSFFEPYFMDGIVAQAVDSAAAAGVAYFSSGGNNGTASYESPFVQSGFPGFFGGPLHDFNPDSGISTLQVLTVPFGRNFSMGLQWDQPFFSVTGGPAASTDLNIYLIAGDFFTILAAGVVPNIASGDPLEFMQFTNTGFDLDGVPGADTTFYLAIEKVAGPSPDLIKYSYNNQGSGITIDTFDTASGPSHDHSNAVGGASVGAAAWHKTPEFGVAPPALESFSSRGGATTLFTTAGAAIVPPEFRIKPEIVAPDAGNTTFFGSDIAEDVDLFPNFSGTSAAAPHAAGFAALMLDFNAALTPAEIYSAMMDSAIDMRSVGWDIDSGFGLIQATTAIDALANTAPTLAPILSQQGVTGDPTLVFALTYADAETATANITLTQSGMPGFCVFDPQTDGSGEIRCTITATDTGRIAIVVTATDVGDDVAMGTPNRSTSQGFYVIANENNEPVMAAVANQQMNDNEVLVIPLSAADADANDTLSFRIDGGPGFCVAADTGPGTGNITCTPGFDNTGIFFVAAVVSDDGEPDRADLSVFQLTIDNVNQAPVLDPIGPQDIDEGVQDTAFLTATDPDPTDTLSYSIINLPSFCGFVDNGDGTADVTCNPSFADAGVYPGILVTVTDDGAGGVLSDSETVTLTVNDINRPPVLDFIGNQAVANNDVLVINITSSDPEGDNVTLTNALPGFCIGDYPNENGTITCTPTGPGDNGTNSVTITATDDGVGNLFTQETFDIVVGDPGAVNNYPVLNPIGNRVVNTGNPLFIPLSASDADGGQALNFQQLDMPGFCVLTDNSNRTGDITCNPVFGDQGAYPMWARVFDDGVPIPPILADSEKFTITVSHVNQPPTANAGPDQELLPLTVANLNGTNSSDLETAMLQFAWTFISVPAGSTVTDISLAGPTTATPSFVPDIDGRYVLELTVTDDGLAIDTDRVRIHANSPSDLYFGDVLNARISMRTLPAGTDPGGAGSKGVTLAGFVIESGVLALATHPFTNVMYGVLDVQGQAGHQLVTIDPTAASPIAATDIGNLGEQIVSMSFDAAGKLYGVSNNTSATTDTLFRINTNTAGLTTVVGLTASNQFAGFGQAISFDTSTNTLFHAYGGGGGFTPMLETIDIVAGTTTPIAYSGDVTGIFDIDGMAYDRLQDRFVGPMSNYTVPAAEFYALSPAGATTTVTTPLSAFAWQGATFFDPIFEPPTFTPEDSNGDGKADIVWREMVSGHNWMYQMDGTQIGSSGPINTVTNLNWKIVGRGDYNGDGKADILWRNMATGQNWMYLMDGNVILCNVPLNIVSNQDWQVVSNGDYDGDGMSDILWYNSATGQVWLYIMNGDIIVTSTSVGTVGNLSWQIVGNADFDGDGKSDVLWYNVVTGQVWVWLMNGAGIATTTGITTVGNLNWTIAGTGDFNGDGRFDILWRNTSTGQVWMWLTDVGGTTIMSSSAVVTVSNLNWVIAGIADYDCDGKADIIWREVTVGHYQMYIMDGNTITTNTRFTADGNLNWVPIFVN